MEYAQKTMLYIQFCQKTTFRLIKEGIEEVLSTIEALHHPALDAKA